MLGVFAEFETNLRRERQLEGISAAKVRGVYQGRKPSIDAAEVIRLRREEKLGPAAIARQLGIGRASVYRLLGKQTAGVSANGGVDADQA
jgi:DNA invertase Pin-like site-specific DNA recombinase